MRTSVRRYRSATFETILLIFGLLQCNGSALAADILYSVTDLGVNFTGVGINNASQVSLNSAGHAFVYSNGQKTDLGSLGGLSHFSVAYALNNAGQVTGFSYTPTHCQESQNGNAVPA